MSWAFRLTGIFAFALCICKFVFLVWLFKQISLYGKPQHNRSYPLPIESKLVQNQIELNQNLVELNWRMQYLAQHRAHCPWLDHWGYGCAMAPSSNPPSLGDVTHPWVFWYQSARIMLDVRMTTRKPSTYQSSIIFLKSTFKGDMDESMNGELCLFSDVKIQYTQLYYK